MLPAQMPLPERTESITVDLIASDIPTFDVSRHSLTLLRVGGTRVRVHASLPLYSICSVLVTLYPSDDRNALIFAAIVHGPALWLTVLAHELSKAAVARFAGEAVGDVILWPYGGLTVVGATGNARRDMLIAASGPLSHIPLCLIVYGVIAGIGLNAPADALDERRAFHAAWLYGLLWLNVATAVFNSISPAYPFDSARFFCAAQVLTGAQPVDAASLLVVCAMPCVPALIIYSLYSLGDDSVIAVLLCALAVWVLLQARLMVYSRSLGVLGQHPLISYMPVRQTVPLPTETAAAADAPPLARTSSEERVRTSSAVRIQQQWLRRLHGGRPPGDARV